MLNLQYLSISLHNFHKNKVANKTKVFRFCPHLEHDTLFLHLLMCLRWLSPFGPNFFSFLQSGYCLVCVHFIVIIYQGWFRQCWPSWLARESVGSNQLQTVRCKCSTELRSHSTVSGTGVCRSKRYQRRPWKGGTTTPRRSACSGAMRNGDSVARGRTCHGQCT